MSDLTAFLLARIDEDESFALSAQAEASIYDAGTLRWHWLVAHSQGSRWHPTTFDPARVRRECEAKRRIVSRCDMVLRGQEHGMFSEGQRTDSVDSLRALASVYSDHPDYDEAWRP